MNKSILIQFDDDEDPKFLINAPTDIETAKLCTIVQKIEAMLKVGADEN